jgi:hypothetical protein
VHLLSKLSFTYRKQIVSIFALFIVFVAVSCTQQQETVTEKLYARVGNEVLTVQEAKRHIPSGVTDDKEQLRYLEQYRSRWIKNRLLAQEARRNALHEQDLIQQRIKNQESQILAQVLRDYWLQKSDSLKVTRNEAQSYYEKHKSQFILQERHVQYRHLQTANLTESRNAKADLMAGISFEDVVDTYALNKSQTLSDSKQFWPISAAAAKYEPLNRYLQIIGIQEISPIRRLDGRYHFVQLIEQKTKGEHPDIDWILNRIQNWLELEKRRKLISNFEQQIYLNAKVNNEIEEFDITS